MSKSKLKVKYRTDFAHARTLVNEFDPCGLVKGGAPVDEYDHLTNTILSAMHEGLSPEEIKSIILRELEEYYGETNLNSFEEPYKTKFYEGLNNLITELSR